MQARTVVLVVEDEVLVRIAAVDMFEDAGYVTLQAENAAEAIRLLENHPEITVVFTDVQMPGSMDGAKLAAAVRKRWPPVRLIVTSGRPRPEDLPNGVPFVPKPYDWSRLDAEIRRQG
jgi:CheY-like chemotaxis protein